jgi:hypothetical protein
MGAGGGFAAARLGRGLQRTSQKDRRTEGRGRSALVVALPRFPTDH